MIALTRFFEKIGESVRLSCGLGASFSDKFRLFALVWWFPLRRALKLRVNGGGTTVRLRNREGRSFLFTLVDSTDVAVLREIFLEGEYDIMLESEPKVILDIGSNVGASVIFFRLKYPSAKIYAFEPNPYIFERLRKNVEQFPHIEVYPYAVADTDGTIDFFVYPDSHISSSLIQRTDAQKPTLVPARSLSSLERELSIGHVDLMKFDIEGGEGRMLRDTNGLHAVGALLGEVHFDLMDDTKESFEKLLAGFDATYRQIKPERYIVTARAASHK